jgi:hypothetical protein
MIAGVDEIGKLDPQVLRHEAQERFSVSRMVEGYLHAYEAMAAPKLRTLAPVNAESAEHLPPVQSRMAARALQTGAARSS